LIGSIFETNYFHQGKLSSRQKRPYKRDDANHQP
jgi:hypothetical protein